MDDNILRISFSFWEEEKTIYTKVLAIKSLKTCLIISAQYVAGKSGFYFSNGPLSGQTALNATNICKSPFNLLFLIINLRQPKIEKNKTKFPL